MLRAAVLIALVAYVSAIPQGGKKEPVPNYPKYPAISTCPESYGLQVYPHPSDCHAFYKCANGTLTEETCENGLLFDGRGDVYNHCNYHWAVNCEGRQFEMVPLEGRGICKFSFGLFSNGPCETYYTKCKYGEPLDEPCIPGLAFDERTHSCNWPDLLEYCVPEDIVGFKCPDYVDSKDPAAKFLPFPRYAIGECGRYIFCVDGKPRLGHCGDYSAFDPASLTCTDPEYVPKCNNYRKK